LEAKRKEFAVGKGNKYYIIREKEKGNKIASR